MAAEGVDQTLDIPEDDDQKLSEFDQFEEEEEDEEEEEEEEEAVIERDPVQLPENREAVYILPEGFSDQWLQIHLGTIITGITQEPHLKIKALEKLSRVLAEVKNEPSVQLPTKMLGRLVAVTCLCALHEECSRKAAETLCQLLPILRRREEMLNDTQWGRLVVKRALAVAANGENPALFQKNCYNQARVFGAFLPPEQILEAVQFLGAELTDTFNSLDAYHLLRELIIQYLGKTVQIEDVLNRICLQLNKTQQGKSVTLFLLPVLALHNLEEVVVFFLKHPFSDCQEHWKVLFGSAQHSRIFDVLVRWMPDVTREAECATKVLQQFLGTAGTASRKVLKEQFPQLFLALLGQMYACGGEHRELMRLSQEMLQELFRAIGLKRGDVTCQGLRRKETFQQGMSTLVRLLINQGAWIIPVLTAYIVSVLDSTNHTTVPELAISIYTDLFLNRRCVQADLRTADCFCLWLRHHNAQVRQLSLRGLSLLLQSEMDPWTMQLAVLSSLSSAPQADVIPGLMNLMEIILPTLSDGEREQAYIRMLTNIYVNHITHEDATVRAAAIDHLCMLRTRGGKQWVPQILGDALAEFVNILIHLDDEEVVAEAAKSALTKLAPEVNWKVAPGDYSLHEVLYQASKYVIKKYKKEFVRDAAFICTLPPTSTLPSVLRVASLFVAYLAHKKPSFMSWDDMNSLCSWLHEMLKHEDAEVRTAARLSAEAVNRAFLEHEMEHTLEQALFSCFHGQSEPRSFTPLLAYPILSVSTYCTVAHRRGRSQCPSQRCDFCSELLSSKTLRASIQAQRHVCSYPDCNRCGATKVSNPPELGHKGSCKLSTTDTHCRREALVLSLIDNQVPGDLEGGNEGTQLNLLACPCSQTMPTVMERRKERKGDGKDGKEVF